MTMEVLKKALLYLKGTDVDVVNISLGGYVYNAEIDSILRDFYEKDISIVAAAGDYGDKDLLFPSSSEYVISVAALSRNMTVADFSNIGESLKCAFPGENIVSVDANNCRQKYSGTSESAALASAYIARLRGVYEHATSESIKEEDVIRYINELNTLNGMYTDFKRPFEDITEGYIED